LAVKRLALLFTDLQGSTALYERIGDMKAFELVPLRLQIRMISGREQGLGTPQPSGDARVTCGDRPTREGGSLAAGLPQTIVGFERFRSVASEAGALSDRVAADAAARLLSVSDLRRR
jgi:adenylate cyclase